MDANQTRFHLLLGETDWATCSLPGAGKVFATNDSPVAWTKARHEVTLQPKPFNFPAAPRDDPPEQDNRRGAAADLNSNWYWIAESRAEIRIQPSGESTSGHFWSAADASVAPPPPTEIFQPVIRPSPPSAYDFSGLAVTEDQYLVVGTLKPKGLLVFDLIGGGAPWTICWPDEIHFEPFDIVPRHSGGVWILDRTNKRFWGLDRTLRVIMRDQQERALTGSEEEIFQPTSEIHHGRFARNFPAGIELEQDSPIQAVAPVAIETLPDNSVLILDAPESGRSRVLRCRFGERVEEARAPGLDFRAYDFAFADEKLFIVSAGGNQAFAFTLGDLAGPLALTRLDEYFPLRRFGGKALVASGKRVYHDFGERWLPLIKQKNPRHIGGATIDTRVFDGREPQCVWHRLMLDACLPAGTDVEISSRAADGESELAITQWEIEPRDDAGGVRSPTA